MNKYHKEARVSFFISLVLFPLQMNAMPVEVLSPNEWSYIAILAKALLFTVALLFGPKVLRASLDNTMRAFYVVVYLLGNGFRRLAVREFLLAPGWNFNTVFPCVLFTLLNAELIKAFIGLYTKIGAFLLTGSFTIIGAFLLLFILGELLHDRTNTRCLMLLGFMFVNCFIIVINTTQRWIEAAQSRQHWH